MYATSTSSTSYIYQKEDRTYSFLGHEMLNVYMTNTRFIIFSYLKLTIRSVNINREMKKKKKKTQGNNAILTEKYN